MTTTTEQLPVYRLARMADCYDPDSATSPGGAWLRLVADAATEALDYARETDEASEDALSDRVHEVADDIVPIYTREVWEVFVDLGAYNEDLDDLGGTTGEMERDAKVALYMIAERLVSAVFEHGDLFEVDDE